MALIERSNAEHYLWGDVCDGWRLSENPRLSVIEERMPPGGAEQLHHHNLARQFFYVLEGELALEVNGQQVSLTPRQGLEVAPEAKHRVRNRSTRDVWFLVISSPTTRDDRILD